MMYPLLKPQLVPFCRRISRIPSLSATIFAVFLFSLPSCTTNPIPAGMDISLSNIELIEATLFETTMLLTVRIINENPDPLTVTGGVYKVDLNGLKIGKGVSGEILEIPRFSTGTTTVTFHISNLALLTRVKALLENQSIGYTIISRVYTRSGQRNRRVYRKKEGFLDFNEKEESLEREPASTASF